MFEHTRRHRRFIVDAMDIRGIATTPEKGDPISFKVRTLSLGGMLVKLRRRYETGNTLQMEMTLPPDVLLCFRGTVTSQDRQNEYYDIGIRFLDMSEKDKTKLKEFIRSLYLKDAGFDD